MKALVTGGTGFIGRHLIEVLLGQGDQVTALIRSPARATGLAERSVRLIPGTLTEMEALRTAARDQEVIYHVAGSIAARNEAEFLEVNRDGTARLVAAAAEVSDARLVLVSSLAAGGPVARGERLRDDEPPRPVTGYGRSKLAGEEVVRRGRLAWTIMRPPAVYGPHDAEMLRVFRAVRLGLMPVFGDGTQELSLVYGPDLAGALAAAGRSAAAAGRIFYPCHPEILTTASVVEEIARAMRRRVRLLRLPRWMATPALGVASTAAAILGRRTILTPDKANEFFAPAWASDPTALERATGWRAGHDLATGAVATAEWYRAAGWL